MSNDNSSNVILFTSGNESVSRAPNERARYNDGGGEPPMKDDYVTHEELDHATDKLSDKIDNLDTKMDGRFDAMNQKFDGRFDVVEEKFNGVDVKFDKLEAKIDNLSKLIWWLMGLVGAGLIVPLLAFVLSTILSK